MKLVYKIVAFVFLLLICTAEDCGNNYSDSQSNELSEIDRFSELEENFMIDELDSERLLVMEDRALQKLEELFGYLFLYSDTGLNYEFRQQLKQTIREYFISEYTIQLFFTELELKEDTINKLLFAKDRMKLNLSSDSFTVLKGLKRESNSTYSGELGFVLNTKEVTDGKINVIAVKDYKYFGKDSVNIWELYFGFKTSN